MDRSYHKPIGRACFYWALVCLLMVSGCALSNTRKRSIGAESAKKAEVIEIKGQSFEKEGTLLRITCTKPAQHTAFMAKDPRRIVLDIMAKPTPEAIQPTGYSDVNLREIKVEKKGDKEKYARITLFLSREADYELDRHGNLIILEILPLKEGQGKLPVKRAKAREESVSPGSGAKEDKPRIFFKPSENPPNQVLGVDYSLLDERRSRLTVTTKKKALYSLTREGKKVLLLTLEECTIPALLQRRLDAVYFQGAVDQVKANYFPKKTEVGISISLREMVPSHIDQKGEMILVDFEASKIPPPKRHLKPVEGGVSSFQGDRKAKLSDKKKGSTPAASMNMRSKDFSRKMINIDFRQETIENVLYFFSRTLDLNIIWDPVDVKGKIVSIELHNVPWDQAIDMTLRTIGLNYRIEGEIWYVLSDKKAKDIEQRRSQRKLEMIKLKRQEEQFQPKLTAHIQVKYRKASDLVSTINTILGTSETQSESEVSSGNAAAGSSSSKTEGAGSSSSKTAGKVYDFTLAENPVNNSLIVFGTKTAIAKIRDLVDKLDVPEKQVMIEARIVEASTSFSQELGVKWGGSYQTQHNPWGGTGDGTYNYNFSTNFAIPTATTAGMSFVNTAATKLLQAQVAFAENEGEVKTLSAPRIMTKNAITATIKQGTQIFEPSGTDANGNKTYQPVDAALQLEVTPTVTPNDYVTMEIKVEDNFPDYANARGENVPIKTKSAETVMRVVSGDTVVIGGIFKEDKSATEEGTPWLRNMPLLGWLFKAKRTTGDRTELLIFLTPTVVPNPTQKSYD